jgi:hypothetical protein
MRDSEIDKIERCNKILDINFILLIISVATMLISTIYSEVMFVVATAFPVGFYSGLCGLMIFIIIFFKYISLRTSIEESMNMNKILNITVNYENSDPLFFSCRTNLIPESSTEKDRAQTILIKELNIPSGNGINKISSVEYFSPVKVMSNGEIQEINLSKE